MHTHSFASSAGGQVLACVHAECRIIGFPQRRRSPIYFTSLKTKFELFRPHLPTYHIRRQTNDERHTIELKLNYLYGLYCTGRALSSSAPPLGQNVYHVPQWISDRASHDQPRRHHRRERQPFRLGFRRRPSSRRPRFFSSPLTAPTHVKRRGPRPGRGSRRRRRRGHRRGRRKPCDP